MTQLQSSTRCFGLYRTQTITMVPRLKRTALIRAKTGKEIQSNKAGTHY